MTLSQVSMVTKTMKSQWQQSTPPLELYTGQRNPTEHYKINALAVAGAQEGAGAAQAELQ